MRWFAIVTAFLYCTAVNSAELPFGNLIAVPQSAGPFGVAMGSDPGKYKDCVPGRDAGTYVCLSLPRPFGPAQGYELEAWPGIGICKITMLGPKVRTGDDGTALRSNADDIADLIKTVYGRYQTFNFSSATRHPDRDPYWMLHLLNGEQLRLRMVQGITIKPQKQCRASLSQGSCYEHERRVRLRDILVESSLGLRSE